MSTAGRILAIEDEQLFLDVYQQLLPAEGYQLATAKTREEALQQLDDPLGWDVVLLDRKLQQGAMTPDTGLGLLEEIHRRAPLAKTIVVTGFPDAAGVNRAFQLGAWDHLEKNGYLADLLRIKLRHAMEGAQERRLGRLGNGHREAEMARLWAEALANKNSQEKGRLLEECLLLLFRSIPGFEEAAINLRTSDEEFDVVIPNKSEDPIWRTEGSYILVEAKNWSTKAGPTEFDRFNSKLDRRYGRVKLGFFVSVNGFTDGFHAHALTERRGESLVVPLDRGDIEALLGAGGAKRAENLRDLHQRTVVGR